MASQWYRALQKQSGVQIAGGPATRKKDARDGGSLFRGGVYARSMPRRTTTATRRRRLLLLRSAVLVARTQVPTFRVHRLRRCRSCVSRQLNCIMMLLTAIFFVTRMYSALFVLYRASSVGGTRFRTATLDVVVAVVVAHLAA